MTPYVTRKNYLEKLFAFKDKDLIKVITGLRRTGKSTLLEIYRNELLANGIPTNQFVSLNFEEMELSPYLNDIDGLYKLILGKLDLSKPCYVFLDEIQNVIDFERLVDGLFVKANIDVYITGSNALLLSGELATLLSGRYIEISILPFSFFEYLSAREFDVTNKYLNFEALFFDYVNETSLPAGINLREGGNDKILNTLKQFIKQSLKKIFHNVIKLMINAHLETSLNLLLQTSEVHCHRVISLNP